MKITVATSIMTMPMVRAPVARETQAGRERRSTDFQFIVVFENSGAPPNGPAMLTGSEKAPATSSVYLMTFQYCANPLLSNGSGLVNTLFRSSSQIILLKRSLLGLRFDVIALLFFVKLGLI